MTPANILKIVPLQKPLMYHLSIRIGR